MRDASDNPAPPRRTPKRIAFIAFDGFQMLDLAGPMEVFSKANDYLPDIAADPFFYELVVASPSGGAISSSAGLQIGATVPLGQVEGELDTILVAGGPEAALRAAATETGLLGWLAERAPRTRRVGSVCSGAFLLGACGLLEGRRATTHWSSTGALEAMLPGTEVVPDAIFVGDGHVFTSAGVTAGIDLALALVEADCGPQVALDAARQLVLYLRRVGGQSQFSTSLAAQAKAADALHGIVAYIADHPEADLSVPALAERAAMSERSFARAFLAETGMTPARYVELVRLDRAKLWLESTRHPLARIAARSGLGSAATLNRVFRRRLGLTPQDYRARFRIEGALTAEPAAAGRAPPHRSSARNRDSAG